LIFNIYTKNVTLFSHTLFTEWIVSLKKKETMPLAPCHVNEMRTLKKNEDAHLIIYLDYS